MPPPAPVRAIAFLAVLVLADLGLGGILDPASRHAVVSGGSPGWIDHALAAPARPLLVIGNSQAYRGIDPAVMEAESGLACSNAGCEGQGIHYYLVLLHHIRNGALRPQRVVVTCFYEDLHLSQAGRVKHFGDMSMDCAPVRAALLAEDPLLPVKRLCSTYRHLPVNPLSLLRSAVARDDQDDHGFAPMDRVLDPGRPHERLALRLGPLQAQRMALYRELFTGLRGHGIRTLAVIMPLYRPSGLDDLERDATERYRALAQEGGAGLLDLADGSVPALRQAEVYFDGNHLNRHGAAIATRLIAQRLRDP